MHDWLKVQRAKDDREMGSPVEYLERLEYLGPDLLAIHANCLGPRDAEILGHRQVHVVHCPRSHAYFGHPPFPAQSLAAAGVNVCLGTDSLASVISSPNRSPELSMFEEMRAASESGAWDPESLVRMASLNGARALGREGQLGELSAGASADLIVLPCGGAGSAETILETVTHFTGYPSHVMIGGQWVRNPEG